MEKRALLAIGISFLILFLWFGVFFPPAKPDPSLQPAPIEIADTGLSDSSRPAPSLAPTDPAAEPVSAEEQETTRPAAIAALAEEEIRLENGLFSVVLTNRGARATSWVLDGYEDTFGRPLQMIADYTSPDGLLLGVELDDAALTTELNEALYQVQRTSVAADDGRPDGERITFNWSDGMGLSVTKSLTFYDDEWLIDVDLDVIDRGRRRPARLAIGPGFGETLGLEAEGRYYYASQAVWNLSGEISRTKVRKLRGQDGSVSGRLLWAGLEDQYFTALVIPADPQADAQWRGVETGVNPLSHPDGEETAALEVDLEPVFSVSVGESGAQLFIGPKKYNLLKALGNDLKQAVWFSSVAFLSAISKFIFLSLVWIQTHVASNWGVAIVLATAALRILLFPLNQYSMVSMKKTQMQMQRIQPKVKSIKNKYKKLKDAQSKQKMNQEMMELYKREGINPAGGIAGCLPMLAQFPILISFYNMLTVAVELRGAPFFGWIQDLAKADPYYVTPLLMGVTMFVQQKIAMSKVKDPVQQQQQKFMMFMPFFFTWICLQMPSGLVLYWFVNNLLGIGQQWLVNKRTGSLETADQKA